MQPTRFIQEIVSSKTQYFHVTIFHELIYITFYIFVYSFSFLNGSCASLWLLNVENRLIFYMYYHCRISKESCFLLLDQNNLDITRMIVCYVQKIVTLTLLAWKDWMNNVFPCDRSCEKLVSSFQVFSQFQPCFSLTLIRIEKRKASQCYWRQVNWFFSTLYLANL